MRPASHPSLHTRRHRLAATRTRKHPTPGPGEALSPSLLLIGLGTLLLLLASGRAALVLRRTHQVRSQAVATSPSPAGGISWR